LQDEFDPLEISVYHQECASSELITKQLQQGDFSLDRHLREQEGRYIAAALELAGGNISEAAKLLGINRTTLHSRMGAHEKLNA
jgi:DNA-binding NtrC family response regulator